MKDISLCVMTRELCHELFQGWENDPAIYVDMERFTPYRYDEKAVDRYFDAKQEPSRVLLAIMKDKTPIGEIQLKRIDRERKACTLSIHMQNDAVKERGYGTQAERLAIRYALGVLGMKAVYADTAIKNTRSQHVLEKVGFQYLREENGFKYYRYEPERELHESIAAFMAWAKANAPGITEARDYNEWDFGEAFAAMTSCAMNVIRNCPAERATEQLINDLLFVIARDHESESMIDELLDHDEWFAMLCKNSLKTNDPDAKWQFAAYLGRYEGHGDTRAWIEDFLSCGDEYTERRALASLAAIDPQRAEAYAAYFWNRNQYGNDEYQKMTALSVLDQIHSSKLPTYLEMAEHSDYEYLRCLAQEIRSRRP